MGMMKKINVAPSILASRGEDFVKELLGTRLFFFLENFLYGHLRCLISLLCYRSRSFYSGVLRTVRTTILAKMLRYHNKCCDITIYVAIPQVFKLQYHKFLSCDIAIDVVRSQFILR